MSDSLDSAPKTALKGLARLPIRGHLTLGEYAERADAIQQATTSDDLDALPPAGAAGLPAARRPRWLISVLAGYSAAVIGGSATTCGLRPSSPCRP